MPRITILTEVGGRLEIFAIAEARLNRSKNSARFPLNAIDYCLRAAGVASLDDVDLIARDQLYDNWPEPMSQVGRELARQNATIGKRTPARETYLLEHSFKVPHSKIRIVNHIDAHAASTYYLSGFEEAAVLTMEGGTGIHHGSGLALRPIDKLGYCSDVFHDGECIEYGETSFKSSNFTNTAILFDTVTERLGYDQ